MNFCHGLSPEKTKKTFFMMLLSGILFFVIFQAYFFGLYHSKNLGSNINNKNRDEITGRAGSPILLRFLLKKFIEEAIENNYCKENETFLIQFKFYIYVMKYVKIKI